jgi:acetyl esterase/lipase
MMRRSFFTGAGASLLLVGCAGKRVPITREVVYSPPSWPAILRGDVYRPTAPGPRPGVLMIHGGGWAGPDRRWHMAGLSRSLAQRGYLVLNVTYRMAPEWRYPAPVDDLRAALRYLAKLEDVDPQKLAVWGYSAGGHLASLLALTPQPADPPVRAVIAGGAPTDLRLYPGGTLVPQFLGGTQAEVPHLFAAASPVTHVTSAAPPHFLYHGTADTLVPLEHAEKLAAALRRADVPVQTHWLEGRNHVGAFLRSGPAIAAGLDFLDRTLVP